MFLRLFLRSGDAPANPGLPSERDYRVFRLLLPAMATLEQLQAKRRELEEKLNAGDLSVETALEHTDRAISSRTLKVQHSRQRLEATKQAVAAGVDKDKARRVDSRTTAKKLAELRARRPLNQF